MVEGLPGSGKSTTARGLAAWLADQRVEVQHWPEGRTDHPVAGLVEAVRAHHPALGRLRAGLPDSQPVA